MFTTNIPCNTYIISYKSTFLRDQNRRSKNSKRWDETKWNSFDSKTSWKSTVSLSIAPAAREFSRKTANEFEEEGGKVFVGWNWWTYSVGDYDRNRKNRKNPSLFRRLEKETTVTSSARHDPRGILTAALELMGRTKGWQRRLVEKTRSRTVMKATVKLLTKSIVYFYLFISLKMNL